MDFLVGSWRLVSWQAIADDGSVEWPMGENAEGLLCYAANGTMMTLLGRAGRARHGGSDLTGSSTDEQAEAMRTFVAYGGRYELSGRQVSHFVEMSLFPNWVGTHQRRQVELDASGLRITLTSPPLTIGGHTRRQRLTFERIGAWPPDLPAG
jgi:hypothetical protein